MEKLIRVHFRGETDQKRDPAACPHQALFEIGHLDRIYQKRSDLYSPV